MRAVGVGTLVAFAALSAWLAARILPAVHGPLELGIVLAAAALALLVSDAISGLVHWACDTYFEEDTPVLGPALIGPFREHHRDPLAMTRHSLLEVNSSNLLSALPILLAALWAGAPGAGASSLLLSAFALSLAQAVGWTNQVHVWAHLEAPPALVRALQRARLALPPGRHARHHRAGSGAYCITTGWLNPLLDRRRVFARLERGIAAAGSVALPVLGLRQVRDQREDRA